MRKCVIAIDFDGTIVESGAGLKILWLRKLARDVINKWARQGCHIVIWTCREGELLDQAVNFLDKHGVTHHEVNDNTTHPKKSKKIHADIFIDDKGLWTNNPIDWAEADHLIEVKVNKFKDDQLKRQTDALKGKSIKIPMGCYNEIREYIIDKVANTESTEKEYDTFLGWLNSMSTAEVNHINSQDNE